MIENSHNSARNKLLAIEYYQNNNVNQSDVAKIFKVSRQTFSLWLKDYKNNRTLERKNRKAMSYKIKQKHVNFAKKKIDKNQEYSISIIWTKLKNKYSDFDITKGHLAEVIRDNNITRKRTTRRHYPDKRYNKPINLKKQMKEFYSKTDNYSLTKIISIDETSIYAEMASNYSRCNLGKRCVKKTTDNRVFIKYTLVCAINSKGVVGYELYKKGGMNSERMIQFIDKFINNKFKNCLIIMDNGGSHKNKSIKTKIEETGNKLLYSVPYKPKTNAIESWFSQFKHYFVIDNNAISFQELEHFVKKTIKKIPKTSYLNYLKYAYEQKPALKLSKKQSTRRKPLKNYKN